MSDSNKKLHKSRKKIIIILSLIFGAVIVFSFLFSFVQLVMEPTSVYIVEKRQNL